MKISKITTWLSLVVISALLITACENDLFNEFPVGEQGGGGGRGGSVAAAETTVATNLSFPVIWSEGVTKTLRIPPAGYTTEMYKIGGDWWYVWGEDPIDPQAPLYSCHPATMGEECFGPVPPADLFKAYVQKDANNYWQAYAANATDLMNIDLIDWGDNLESVPWTLTSRVRTEVVLYENLLEPVREYAMRHVYGWGTDELHGLQTTTEQNPVPIYGPGTQATVFSPHARLTIQKLVSENPAISWNAAAHAWSGTDVLPPAFNKAVWEASDGPGYYNAEINIKGKLIYGYTWDVKKTNNGAGTYRITFSFDATGPATTLNTFFDGNSQVLLPEEIVIEAEESKGGTAYIDIANNLTYIDVVILPGKSGGAKGGGNSGGGGKGVKGGGKPVK